ncbi:hypothetical protein CIL03_17030 [Virgibacillus indicus]|uniref:Uncharacterized protein n=1 Tax=Virgibacillus indicus TaxID=2024554 RepID=A0A265N677_9BACI|nr:Ger(x)C family spore germination protein [Virgibacillus indicus]OZU87301.1 hypothetical protein CIL03_17030 [Virgibacillus indicus]
MNNRLLILLCCMIIMLSGCWDENDIEERGFVIGAAIDLAEDEQGKDSPTLTLTNQFVVPAGIGMPGGGGGEQKAFSNISGSGESLFGIIREMSTTVSRAPYFEHLKVIIISEEVARQPDLFGSIIDLFIRDQEMRREIKIVISEQNAQKVMKVEPEAEQLPIMYMNDVMDNTVKAGGLLEPVRMGDMHEYLLEESNYVIPRVYSLDNRIKFKGAGVFRGKSNRLVGNINDDESVGLNLITNSTEGGFIKFEINNKLMIYELKKTKNTIKIDTKDQDNIKIDITIDTEGNIGEMYGERSLLEKDFLREIEQKVNEKIELLANNVIKKGQEELQLDFFGFSDILKQKHYETWNEVKDNWDQGDNIFAKSTINVTADSIIRTTGASDRVKDQGSE